MDSLLDKKHHRNERQKAWLTTYVEALDWLEHGVFLSMMQGTTKGGTSPYSSIWGEPRRDFNPGLSVCGLSD
jgi:hypothetical protein